MREMDGRVYAQAVFGMRGDATVSFRDEDLAFLDHGLGNLPFDFPAMVRLRQMVRDTKRGKEPRGWVMEVDFHGTTFAIRRVMGEPYKVFVKHGDGEYSKIHEEEPEGTN